jgi:hypothetical protein
MAIALASLGPSGELYAQAVVVWPKCGSPATHFILSTAGWTVPRNCGNGHCFTSYDVFVDGTLVVPPGSLPNCIGSFTIDLSTLTCVECTVILGPGG